MNIFENKKILKQIALVLTVVLIFNFIMPNTVVYAESGSWVLKAGGNLLSVVLDFLMYIGDAILEILQHNFLSTDKITIPAHSGEFKNPGTLWDWLRIGAGVLLIVAAILIAVFSGGAGAPIAITTIAEGIKVVGGIVLLGGFGVGSAIWGTVDVIKNWTGEFDLPMIRYTPYEIFSNQIPLFDINFVHPMEDITEKSEKTLSDKSKTWYIVQTDPQDNINEDDPMLVGEILDFGYVTLSDLNRRYKDKGDPAMSGASVRGRVGFSVC